MSTNLFTNLPSNLPGELITMLIKGLTCASNASFRTAIHRLKAFGAAKTNMNGLSCYKEPLDCRMKVNPKN